MLLAKIIMEDYGTKLTCKEGRTRLNANRVGDYF
jgi:hypothetical protein